MVEDVDTVGRLLDNALGAHIGRSEVLVHDIFLFLELVDFSVSLYLHFVKGLLALKLSIRLS